MTLKATYIQQATPAKRGPRAGNDTSDLASLGFHLGEHRFDSSWNGNTERLTSSTLRAGKGKHAIFQIHAGQRNLRLTQSAPRSQGDLKADSHPFRHSLNGQSLSGNFNLIIRKNRFNAGDRPTLNSVIQKGDRIHLSEQSALAVNPLKNFEVLARLVATSFTAGRAGKALAPSQINFAIESRKRLQGYFFFDNKSRKMTPAISVIHFCQRGNGMILDQLFNPIVATIFSLFVHAKSSGLGRCLCAMQSVIDSVAGAFTTPFSSRVFKSNKEPRAAAFLVRIRHGYKGNIWAD